MIINKMEISKAFTSDEIEIRLSVEGNQSNIINVENVLGLLKNEKVVKVGFKEFKQRRSLDANAYCWVLCDKIAKKVGSTKEKVYQKFIRDIGVFEILRIQDENLERWVEVWGLKGLGWQCESLGKSDTEGYTNTINYFGSSVYDSKEMAKLLEEIIYQATELEIETITPNEKEQLLSKWQNRG